MRFDLNEIVVLVIFNHNDHQRYCLVQNENKNINVQVARAFIIIKKKFRFRHFCLKIGPWKSGAQLKWLTV